MAGTPRGRAWSAHAEGALVVAALLNRHEGTDLPLRGGSRSDANAYVSRSGTRCRALPGFPVSQSAPHRRFANPRHSIRSNTRSASVALQQLTFLLSDAAGHGNGHWTA